ncbi:MAG TPA: hypothetical protein VFW31_11560 [Candidatus Angelobacter sp.]|nr:hypothetical protein [Candidatus Angelobacter sp.]
MPTTNTVNNGKIQYDDALTPVRIRADSSNRLALPRNIVDHMSWLSGSEIVHAWLLVLSLGRYRLLTDDEVKSNPDLEPVRDLVLRGQVIGRGDLITAEEPKRAAMAAKLLPTIVTPPGPTWRIVLPKAIAIFIPADCDAKDFILFLTLDGFWELWNTHILHEVTEL